MKRTSLLLIAILMVSAIGAAQFTTDREIVKTDGNGQILKFVASVPLTDSIASASFTLSEYDAESFSTYPIAYGRKVVSADSTPQVFARILGTYGDGTWFVVDTIAANDSVAAYSTGTLDLNNKKCAAYKISLKGLTGNPDDPVWTFSVYAYRKDLDLIAR